MAISTIFSQKLGMQTIKSNKQMKENYLTLYLDIS